MLTKISCQGISVRIQYNNSTHRIIIPVRIQYKLAHGITDRVQSKLIHMVYKSDTGQTNTYGIPVRIQYKLIHMVSQSEYSAN